MLKKRDVPYYRRREEAELERAVHADSDAARKAHLRLADLYHDELTRRERMLKIGDRDPGDENP